MSNESATCRHCGAVEEIMTRKSTRLKVVERATQAGVDFPCCRRCFRKQYGGTPIDYRTSAAFAFNESLQAFESATLALKPLDLTKAKTLVSAAENLWNALGLLWTGIQVDGDKMNGLHEKVLNVRLPVFCKRVKRLSRMFCRLTDATQRLGAVVNLNYEQCRNDARKELRKEWLRNSIMQDAGFRCEYCKSTERLHIDHVVPIIRNGKTERGNLQVLCASCNARKGSDLVSSIS